jgi:hypothetical protein
MSPESGAEQNWSYLKGKKIVESRDAVGDNVRPEDPGLVTTND